MKKVKIYTDGACSGNPGPGGWAGIIIFSADKEPIEISGNEYNSTNNRMELMAVIKSVKLVQSMRTNAKDVMIDVHSDSAYVVNAVKEKWLDNWKKRDWLTLANIPVKNKDLWLKLSKLLSKDHYTINMVKVKGHSNNVLNNECDKLAKSEVEKIK